MFSTFKTPFSASGLRVSASPRQFFSLLLLLNPTLALSQPKILGPARQSHMQDSNLKTALPNGLAGVGIDQKLDQQIPLDLNFKDEFGRTVPLRSFFKSGKPVILAPVYYRCPMLCTQ